ncbi:ETS homologous factor-like isoform X2 [Argopecten irradians]|uniref:ETS homologous factor-like isoform X2 n=1 Tax=Argopecten irradians TaxID=31199 RepID=UPI0037198407
MSEHVQENSKQKDMCFVELQQVPLSVYGQRINKTSLPSSYSHQRHLWKLYHHHQNDSKQTSDNLCNIREAEHNIFVEPTHERLQPNGGGCHDAGYLYPVDASQDDLQREDSPETFQEDSHTTPSPVSTSYTQDVVQNVENMKVTSENGEVIVELYGFHYPIDVSGTIDINARQLTVPSTGSRPESVYPCSKLKTESLCSDSYPAKRYKPKESSRSKCRQKRMQRGCRLWEFIRDLLQNPVYNPSHIKWIDRSVGEFRLVKSNQIARMWGAKKNNECMTYEKLSRAMRYYYKREILSPVLGKRLVYRFGAKSYGW